MKGYILRITVAILVSCLSQMIIPKGWEKYIKIITGLIIISTIASGFGLKLNLDFSDNLFDVKTVKFEGEEYKNNLIKEEFAKKINEDIEKRANDEFGVRLDADVEIDVNEENEIVGILKIELTGDNILPEVIDRIEEIYAPSEVAVNGDKKNP